MNDIPAHLQICALYKKTLSDKKASLIANEGDEEESCNKESLPSLEMFKMVDASEFAVVFAEPVIRMPVRILKSEF